MYSYFLIYKNGTKVCFSPGCSGRPKEIMFVKVLTRLEVMSNVTSSQWIDKIGYDGCMHVIFSIEWVVF